MREHKFYKGIISNPFSNKLRVTAENGNTLWTNSFDIAKEHALQNLKETQFKLFI